MTKNAVAKNWQWDGGDTGTGGTYNSNQPGGGDEMLSINGSGFGLAPIVIAYAKWTEGNEGEQLNLTSIDVGDDFDSGSYATGLAPKLFTLDGSLGASIREGGTNAVTDNKLTGFVKVLPNFTEYLIALDMGVPVGRHFSMANAPLTLPVGSGTKLAWLSDQPLDDPALADIVPFSYVGTASGWLLVGNQAPPPISIGSSFDFDTWNGFLAYQKAGADPVLDNGISETVTTSPSTGTLQRVTNLPTFAASATNKYYNRVNFPAWTGNAPQDLTQHLFRYYYLAVGANARARLELGDNAVYANCGYRRVIPHTAWSDTNVTVTTDSKQRSGMTHWFITDADGVQQSGEFS